MSRPDGRFARIPRRVFNDLERHEITLADLGLLVWFAGQVDYRTGEIARTVPALESEANWSWTREHLRNRLGFLRGRGELAFEDPGSGSKKPIIFRLVGDGFGLDLQQTPLPVLERPAEPPTDLQQKRGGPLEVASNDSTPSDPADPDGQTESDQRRPPTGEPHSSSSSNSLALAIAESLNQAASMDRGSTAGLQAKEESA